jgi:DNA-binding transcriptional MerR regulator/methylmalonyl-CoA mutase cobalamin-binding subunit
MARRSPDLSGERAGEHELDTGVSATVTDSARSSEPRHPIGVVSARTGITQDVLRAWERRYRTVVPHRTETGRRLYSDQDLERFRLLKRLVDSGRRISDVAHLSREELIALAREDRAGSPGGGLEKIAPRGGESVADLFEEALAAIRDMDGDRLRRVLRAASLVLTPVAMRRELLGPLLVRTGEDWRSGSCRIANEHLASSVIRSFLGEIHGGEDLPPSAPSVVISTPVGQLHEIGALMSAAAAAEVGWRAVYLGPNLPAEEIAAAVRQRGARAAALSVVFPGSDPRVVEELTRLRRLLGDDVPILVGGSASPTYETELQKIGATRVEDCGDFQSALAALTS